MVGKRQKEMEERESRIAWKRGDIYRCVGWGGRVGWAGPSGEADVLVCR